MLDIVVKDDLESELVLNEIFDFKTIFACSEMKMANAAFISLTRLIDKECCTSSLSNEIGTLLRCASVK